MSEPTLTEIENALRMSSHEIVWHYVRLTENYKHCWQAECDGCGWATTFEHESLCEEEFLMQKFRALHDDPQWKPMPIHVITFDNDKLAELSRYYIKCRDELDEICRQIIHKQYRRTTRDQIYILEMRKLKKMKTEAHRHVKQAYRKMREEALNER